MPSQQFGIYVPPQNAQRDGSASEPRNRLCGFGRARYKRRIRRWGSCSGASTRGAIRRWQASSWRTSTEVARAFAEITEAGPGPEFVVNATRVDAVSQALLTDLGTAHYHTVRFQRLKPSTKYAYRVGDGRNFSEWFHFNTASDRPGSFSFIYFGDAQTTCVRCGPA